VKGKEKKKDENMDIEKENGKGTEGNRKRERRNKLSEE
jgi:hypothetical protein